MNKVKRVGSYLTLDDQGFVIGVKSQILDGKWKQLVDSTIKYYQQELQDDLHSVYIRGSVAKNEAVDFISDLDTFAITHSDSTYDLDPEEEFNDDMMKTYSFCTHIEIGAISLKNLYTPPPKRERSIWEELIKTQSICVFGDNLSKVIRPFKLSEMHGHSLYIHDEVFNKLPTYIEEDREKPKDLEQLCSWIIRRIIRGAFDLVMERERKFTRDLYLCYETTIKYYPSKKTELYQLLEISINPSADVDRWLPIVNSLALWIQSEREKLFT